MADQEQSPHRAHLDRGTHESDSTTIARWSAALTAPTSSNHNTRHTSVISTLTPDLPAALDIETLPSGWAITPSETCPGELALTTDRMPAISGRDMEDLQRQYEASREKVAQYRVQAIAREVMDLLQPQWGYVPEESPRVTSRFQAGSAVSYEVLEIIQQQYERFAQRADIMPTNLISHIGNGNAVVWRPYETQDYFVGQFIGEVFAVSHFAPENGQLGRAAMMELRNTTTPCIFAVPERLAAPLEKLGFHHANIQVPMCFRDELQMKHIFVNHAFTEADLKTAVGWYWAQGVLHGQWDGLSTSLNGEIFGYLPRGYTADRYLPMPPTNQPERALSQGGTSLNPQQLDLLNKLRL